MAAADLCSLGPMELWDWFGSHDFNGRITMELVQEYVAAARPNLAQSAQRYTKECLALNKKKVEKGAGRQKPSGR